MTDLIAISGSLRRGSFNTALLRAARELAAEHASIEVVSVAGIPSYDGDVEGASGIPDIVSSIKGRIQRADGLLIATPEYNHGFPGVLKNAFDWLSRPPGDVRPVFGGKPVGVIGATPGPGGTRYAQAAWLPVFHALGLRIFSERKIFVARAGDAFDADGELIDAALKERLAKYVESFAHFAALQKAG